MKKIQLPSAYVVGKIYELVRGVKHKTLKNSYNFPCPICHEGRSKNKKRGFYFEKENYFFCHNCQKSWSPANWIMQIEGITFGELMRQVREGDYEYDNLSDLLGEGPETPKQTYTLPFDSINLSDSVQLDYHKDNAVVKHCLKYIKTRRLHKAINRPKTFYVSLNDFTHKNRLCIPFYDADGSIIYYQTRAMYEKDESIAKYLCKADAEKALFGISNIDTSLENIFIFEGPIDSMFCRNGVAACGLSLNEMQRDQIDKYRLYNKVWVLDNQLNNTEVKDKYKELITAGENVFFWPEEFINYKDVNEICQLTGKNHIPYKLFMSNTYSGMQAELKLNSY